MGNRVSPEEGAEGSSGFLEEPIPVGQVGVNSWDRWLFLAFSSF